MTWRQFIHYLGGLSTTSRFAQAMTADRRAEAKRKTYGSQSDLDAAMDAAYGG